MRSSEHHIAADGMGVGDVAEGLGQVAQAVMASASLAAILAAGFPRSSFALGRRQTSAT